MPRKCKLLFVGAHGVVIKKKPPAVPPAPAAPATANIYGAAAAAAIGAARVAAPLAPSSAPVGGDGGASAGGGVSGAASAAAAAVAAMTGGAAVANAVTAAAAIAAAVTGSVAATAAAADVAGVGGAGTLDAALTQRVIQASLFVVVASRPTGGGHHATLAMTMMGTTLAALVCAWSTRVRRRRRDFAARPRDAVHGRAALAVVGLPARVQSAHVRAAAARDQRHAREQPARVGVDAPGRGRRGRRGRTGLGGRERGRGVRAPDVYRGRCARAGSLIGSTRPFPVGGEAMHGQGVVRRR